MGFLLNEEDALMTREYREIATSASAFTAKIGLQESQSLEIKESLEKGKLSSSSEGLA